MMSGRTNASAFPDSKATIAKRKLMNVPAFHAKMAAFALTMLIAMYALV